MKKKIFKFWWIHIFLLNSFMGVIVSTAQVPFLPSSEERYRPFGDYDIENFKAPPKVYAPETWFHFIGGNVSKEGITKDLEAIAEAGISGIHLFHGQFGGPWPGVEPQITSLSLKWDDAVRHTAEECRRLGLRFVMQNCPGWATAGGPWIEPSNAMRHIVWRRTDVKGESNFKKNLSMPQPNDEPWRDYQDITVLAFPTPLDDTGEPLIPAFVKSNLKAEWNDFLSGKAKEPINIKPTTSENPQWIEVTFPEPVKLRSVEFPSIRSFNHRQCYEPGVTINIQAVLPDGNYIDILHTEMPQSNWQDHRPITLACSEVSGVSKYRISIVNNYDMSLSSLRLFTAARKNNWESEAGWTLRSIERAGEFPNQSSETFLSSNQILDISEMMNKNGVLSWTAPPGNWTILRIGHVNTGERNGPAPPEGTGWECDKLSKSGPDAHFPHYIGRLSGKEGPLNGGLMNGMLIDSWECNTQTWTPEMEKEFLRVTNYSLRKWLPALFGYVIDSHEITKRFLFDWRTTINNLVTNNFYGQMAKLAHENGLYITYETAAGDVFPADILEYFKYADVPMCEFWQPMTDDFVGSLNFKPIKPTASAARLYGKPRVAAEAFTSFNLTWDERFEMLKETANFNIAEGVTHMVFHTYTHNPQKPFLPPGTSFGSNIGTPFLRGQTWWKFMPEFTTYLARCGYLLERGHPVSDILWYLGDELNHKPNQNAPFPDGFKYDYCNPDVLLNRLTVENGRLFTPEGISYRILWLPENFHMAPETLGKIFSLIKEGAIVVGNAPKGISTLIGGESAKKRYDKMVEKIWGESQEKGIHNVGKGTVVYGMSLDEALKLLKIEPDVLGGDVQWIHRKTEGADWYFVSAPKEKEFTGTLDFRISGTAELWDPVTGSITSNIGQPNGTRTSVNLDLPKAGSCFLVFKPHENSEYTSTEKINDYVYSEIYIKEPWSLSFPPGWGAPSQISIPELRALIDLEISAEAKAFSGTVTYKNKFEIKEIPSRTRYFIELGQVDMVAVVSVNGEKLRPLWASPYTLDITNAVKQGMNNLSIEVTSTWFNRLVFDANQPEADRKTWTINGPDKNSELRKSGLIGPVKLYTKINK